MKLFAGAIATESDDSARQHMANIVNQYDEANTIAKIERTLRSPDHNPIDHFWDVQQRQIQQMDHAPSNTKDPEVVS